MNSCSTLSARDVNWKPFHNLSVRWGRQLTLVSTSLMFFFSTSFTFYSMISILHNSSHFPTTHTDIMYILLFSLTLWKCEILCKWYRDWRLLSLLNVTLGAFSKCPSMHWISMLASLTSLGPAQSWTGQELRLMQSEQCVHPCKMASQLCQDEYALNIHDLCPWFTFLYFT